MDVLERPTGVEETAGLLKAVADPARLRILEFLLEPQGECCARDDGVCGCDFETLLDLSQPTVSHHLKILVQAGLLRAQKRGRWTYYALEPQGFDRLSGYLARFGGEAAAESVGGDRHCR